MADRRPLKRNLSTGTPREFNHSMDRAEIKGFIAVSGSIIEEVAGELYVSDTVLTTPLTISQLRTALNNLFDNTSNGFVSTDVQAAIEEVNDNAAVSASPGFTWGRGGNIPNGTWLLNDAVPSNRAGRTVSLTDPVITQIFVANEDISTFDLTIYEHEGDEVNLTSLTTVSVVATRSADFTVSVAMTSGRQLAVKLTSGSAKNLVVGTQLSGSSS